MLNRIVLSILAALVFISSCTIEKRRYVDGYSIEWKKKIKDVNYPETNKNSSGREEISADHKMAEESNFHSAPINNVSDTVDAKIMDSKEDIPTDMSHDKVNIPPSEKSGKVDAVKSTHLKTGNKQKTSEVKSINPYQESDNGVKKGIYMLILALLLFGLGYLFSIILGVFGIILFWIFGIGAVVYFLVGLFFIIRG